MSAKAITRKAMSSPRPSAGSHVIVGHPWDEHVALVSTHPGHLSLLLSQRLIFRECRIADEEGHPRKRPMADEDCRTLAMQLNCGNDLVATPPLCSLPDDLQRFHSFLGFSKTNAVFIDGHVCCVEFRLAALRNQKIVLTTANNKFFLLHPTEIYYRNNEASCQSGMEVLSRQIQVDSMVDEHYQVDLMVACCLKGAESRDIPEIFDSLWEVFLNKVITSTVIVMITSACTN